MIHILRISHQTTLEWMPQDLTRNKASLVQVMAWCLMAPSHYLNQCWPSSITPHGNTRPQWVDSLWPSDTIRHHRSWSTSVQVTACWLAAPSHYLNQCWLTIMGLCVIHLRAISQLVLKLLFCILTLKIVLLKFLPHLPAPGINELTHGGLVTPYGNTDLGQHWLR